MFYFALYLVTIGMLDLVQRLGGRGSVFGIATGYGLDGSLFDLHWGK